MSTMTMAKAINAGLRAGLAADPKTLLMGEDIGALGGVYRITEGLQAEFGTHRVMDTPLAESGIIGTAIGLALRGYRPVCEIQFDGFVFPGFNQITTQLAKMHSRSEGALSAPVVIRIPRRRHRLDRAPLGIPRSPLRAHRRTAHPRPVQPAGRLLDDPAGHAGQGSGDRV